jgi:hypothetical protein
MVDSCKGRRAVFAMDCVELPLGWLDVWTEIPGGAAFGS